MRANFVHAGNNVKVLRAQPRIATKPLPGSKSVQQRQKPLIGKSAIRSENGVDASQATKPGDWLVLGGDIGGTSTRILVAGYDGVPLGRGKAGGGNPVSHPDTAAAALAQALGEAISGIDPARVRSAVVGVAGGPALARPEVGDAFARVWSGVGLTSPTYVSDLEVAFASATAELDGTVLIAGTGAVAGALRERHLVRTADGHGWLLGDDGSGFWLGREAVRAALRSIDSGTPRGELASRVLRELGVSDAPGLTDWSNIDAQRSRVIQILNSRPAVRLAELAPLVIAAHEERDPLAVGIVEEAARMLGETVGRVRDPDERTPIVLAGSLVREDSPVGARLRKTVAERYVGPVLTAANGVGGAAWLALAAADPSAATDDIRTRLTLA